MSAVELVGVRESEVGLAGGARDTSGGFDIYIARFKTKNRGAQFNREGTNRLLYHDTGRQLFSGCEYRGDRSI
jgi:hypothetical protein